MNNLTIPNQGNTTSWNENVIRVLDSIIIRIFSDGRTGYVTIQSGFHIIY